MIIKNFPHLRQTFNYDCGASALQAILFYYDYDIREGKLMKISKTSRRHGTNIKGLEKVLKKFKISYAAGKMTLKSLEDNLKKKRPVLICLQAWGGKNDYEHEWEDGHYVVVIGYDKKNLYFSDPASVRPTYLSKKEFLKRWHDRDEKRKYINFGIVLLRPEEKVKKDRAILMG